MNAHPLCWHTPLPLWARFGSIAETAALAPDQFRPALLRFASDAFMDEMLDILARAPSRLGQLLARPETWRTPPARNASVGEGLISRIPLPRIVEAAARSRALTRAPDQLEPVAASRTITEQSVALEVPLKLFQPAHQRYYLVTASLVCAIGGLPERRVVPSGAEQVGFVLRRLLPASGPTDAAKAEFAFVKDTQGTRWQRVANTTDDRVLAPGEELLPLFPLQFRDELSHLRTLWTGLVPVARREEYLGTSIVRTAVSFSAGQRDFLKPETTAGQPANSKRARLIQFQMEVAEPWKTLIRAAATARTSLKETSDIKDSGETADQKNARLLALNLQWQMQSWLILLDFADYLAAHLPNVWNAIAGGGDPATLSANERELYDRLGTATMSSALRAGLQEAGTDLKPPAASLREALKRIRVDTVRTGLETTTVLYSAANSSDSTWPDFHFLFAGLDTSFELAGAYAAVAGLAAAGSDVDPDAKVGGQPAPPGQTEAQDIDRVTALVVRALQANQEDDAPPLPFAAQLRDALAATPGDPGSFVIRCVYVNRDCGPLHPPVMSTPSQQFQLANFFDADAPARPIRVTLPADTTPAGLRKHSKNTAFVISDVLCGQIQRAKGLGLVDLVRQVLPWPLHKDIEVGDGGPCQNGGGINIGMICSLSIPIITLCALILLMIIISLLDFIFRWMPYFIICLPVPGLKGKKG